MNKFCLLVSSALIFFISEIGAQQQQQSSVQIKALVDTYKTDPRGPYLRIKWFCDDGTQREPKDPCPDNIGGLQHANFKESTLKLRITNHLFLGEILVDNKPLDFLDINDDYSRLKQYQINAYLGSIDDGWILRKAQYYRGAIQSEDEEAWGKEFFEIFLKDDAFLDSHYYLIRQVLRDIPHNGDDNLAQLMRSQSKILSEAIPSFMDARIKIHGQPQNSDIELVKTFMANQSSKISEVKHKEFEALVLTMETFYAPLNLMTLESDIKRMSLTTDLNKSFSILIESSKKEPSAEQIVVDITNVLYQIRLDINKIKSSKTRLLILDLSNRLEQKLLIESQNWETPTLAENLHKINTLICASMGTGLIENWEYNAIENVIPNQLVNTKISISGLNELLVTSRGVVEWSASMVKANYQEIVEKYTAFEPLAYGFIDDRVRSSIALSLGNTVSDFGAFVAKLSNIENKVMAIDNQTSIRGLNPGYAYGTFIVVDGNPNTVEVDTKNIYIFEKPPADLKPIAGIMTVSEGNLVSHVQLLARNLGIPNAALSYDNLKELKQFSGKKVFYAVSNKGNVILKLEDDMSSSEKELFSKKERSKNVVEVPTAEIKLDINTIVNMRDVDASDSGKLCGPKAANLGGLKKMFPEQVVEGLIIPFGIFRSHMNQQMPGVNTSYWEYLNTTFDDADKMKSDNVSEDKIEAFQLEALSKLYTAMLDINLDVVFVADMKSNFKSVFGASMGEVPVFLRSDTNMEDLKEFTGAGLNLTLFNIKEEDKIIEGIKRVWASAYSERSFKWRQKFLSNPENVFPSILIIPSVDVDYSGVMITKGINSGNDDDLTVAFSRGAGGAVDGQSAETRLITTKGNVLLSPARQPDYIRLPLSGGTKRYTTPFETPILNESNLSDIRELASAIRKSMTSHSDSEKQAYDVEFGFQNNKLWLFQIRPFVENKQAKSSDYLASISFQNDEGELVMLKTKL
ncbi:phosphoenolpyruvate synthase [Psychroserpens burtonensis]|uniref:Phosphoenolpyruvate synthase n=1 Tax=Psychroserpens burtonensis TaxID=49278 RepID=A0A5C7BDG1_9FLAO|nr:PEP/pyruvate-binding domain-containing protein [Psychroserpens burtonensis]TXE19637.1 phosphoenolpyruvate synthase [Psychroserpens burtonensis]